MKEAVTYGLWLLFQIRILIRIRLRFRIRISYGHRSPSEPVPLVRQLFLFAEQLPFTTIAGMFVILASVLVTAVVRPKPAAVRSSS